MRYEAAAMIDDHGHPDTVGPPLPRFTDFVAALGALTCLPGARPDPHGATFARATLFFPLVGLLIGAILVGLNRLIGTTLPPWGSSVVLVASWAALARDSHAVRTDQGKWKTGNREPGMENRLMEGPLTGYSFSIPGSPFSIFRALPFVATWLIKLAGLSLAVAARPGALLFAPLLGRWCMVVLAVGARDAAAPGRKFNSRINFREFALTSVTTGLIVFTLAQALGILIFVCVGAAVLLLRLLAHRWRDGITWRFLLASSQGIEALVVALFALL